MDKPTRNTTDQEHARALWLRTEDVVKLRLLLSAMLRLAGIAVVLFYGYSTAAWVLYASQNSMLGSMLYWIGQPAMLTIAGAALAYAAPAIARMSVPARITTLRCPDCGYELTELREGRCTECNYLLSPLRPEPATPLERAAGIHGVFTAIYRLIGLSIAAWATVDLIWLMCGAAFAMESMRDWFAQENADIDTFILYRGIVVVLGICIVYLGPKISRLTVPPLATGSRTPADP